MTHNITHVVPINFSKDIKHWLSTSAQSIENLGVGERICFILPESSQGLATSLLRSEAKILVRREAHSLCFAYAPKQFIMMTDLRGISLMRSQDRISPFGTGFVVDWVGGNKVERKECETVQSAMGVASNAIQRGANMVKIRNMVSDMLILVYDKKGVKDE